MKLLIKFAINAAAVWVAVSIVPGLDFEGSPWAFAGIAVIMVAASWTVKPLLSVLSLPLVVLTLGLFMLIVNALVFQFVVWLSTDVFDLGLTSTGFFWATFLGALVISVVRMVLDKILD